MPRDMHSLSHPHVNVINRNRTEERTANERNEVLINPTCLKTEESSVKIRREAEQQISVTELSQKILFFFQIQGYGHNLKT